MERSININQFTKNYSHYYQKILISLILAKSKKNSQWFCIFMRIILLRNKDNISYTHPLISRINENCIQLKFYILPIGLLDDLISNALNGKVKYNDDVYNFYDFTNSSNSQCNYEGTVNNCENTIDYPGYIFSRSQKGSFSSILQEFLLTDSDVGINSDNFHKILKITNNYFNTNMILIVFPLFIKELSLDQNYKIYEIDDNLYKDIHVSLYDDDGNNFEDLIQVEPLDSTLIKIPFIESKKKINFEVFHNKFADLITKELQNKAEISLENSNSYHLDSFSKLNVIFNKFHSVAKQLEKRHKDRDTIQINDEYDVQDLLHSLCVIFFKDIRDEETNPSFANILTRNDFLLSNEKIIIETKFASSNNTKKLGEEMIIDIPNYKRHPDCKSIFFFIYDPTYLLQNRCGLKNDIENLSDEQVKVKVYIRPE